MNTEYGKPREPYVDNLLRVRPTPSVRPYIHCNTVVRLSDNKARDRTLAHIDTLNKQGKKYGGIMFLHSRGVTWMAAGWVPIGQDDYGDFFEVLV